MYGSAAKDAMITVNCDLTRNITHLSSLESGVLIQLSILLH
jgi:hypothetical protein